MASPPYISWTGHGAASGLPPGVFTNAVMHVFGIDAEPRATQRLVDTFVNVIGGVSYSSIPGMVLITFMDVERCTSGAEVVGWVPGRECAIWVPLFESHGLDVLQDRVVLWSPYILISYGIGMVTGREVWGWPKQLGRIDLPADGAAVPVFECSTLIFPKFGQNTEGIDAPLITVTGSQPVDPRNSIWSEISDAAKGLVAAATGQRRISAVPNPLGIDLVVPAIAVKQFRDSMSPTLACFQAIVNSPVRFTGFSGGGFHPGSFTLDIATCDSHQIVQDLLGVTPHPNRTSLPVNFAAWIAFNFEAIAGSVIARSI